MDGRVITTLAEIDPQFRGMVDLLYGEGLSKSNPGAPDVHVDTARRKRERTQARVGLASNILGIGAGAHGLYEAAKHPAIRGKVGSLTPVGEAFRVSRRTKALAIGAVGLQAANLAGDAVANRVLARSAKNDKPPKPKKQPVGKSDYTWTGEISKVDTDRRQVFGWCSLSEIDGNPVVDLQGDWLPIEETEKAAYRYVIESRKGGDMHKRVRKGLTTNWDEPLHTADLVESFVVTPEKLAKLGLPEDALPLGWWVGFQVNDDEQWNLVKAGRRTGFSIHGQGVRKEMEPPNSPRRS